jgi:hypothetical protein
VHVPSADAAAAVDASGGSPESAGAFPGLLGAGETVFHVGPGRHDFCGPDVRPLGEHTMYRFTKLSCPRN